MNIFQLYIYPALIFLTMLFFVEHPIFRKKVKILEKATQIEFFQIAEQAIAPNMQEKDKLYAGDYEILKSISFSEEEKSKIKEAILNAENYTDMAKSCPFQAKFAVKFTRRKKFITLVFSSENCKKIQIFSSVSSLNKKYHDLSEVQSILALLKI